MNPSPDTPKAPPVRLLVTSAAEAAKVREFAAAWATFEPAAARAGRSKRCQALRTRLWAVLRTAWSAPSAECIATWLDWQTLRGIRASVDFVEKKLTTREPFTTGVGFYRKAFVTLNRGTASMANYERWHSELLLHAIAGDGEPEQVMLKGVQEMATWCGHQLMTHRLDHRSGSNDDGHIALAGFGRYGQFDAGHRAALAHGSGSLGLQAQLTGEREIAALLSPAALAERRDTFLRAYANLRKVTALSDALMERQSRLIRSLIPSIAPPPRDWPDAHFAQWLFDESALVECERLCGLGRATFNFDTPFDVPLFLSAPLCWRLWLDEQWDRAGSASPTAEPQRMVLRQLVESPARFLRFPNPTAAVADLRRALRPVSDLLEGPPLAVERAAVLAALGHDAISPEELLQLLAAYCARRWAAGVTPKIQARLVERFSAFLREEILPQAPDILRSCAVEVGPALRTTFEAEFDQLVATEEAEQEKLAVELRHQAEAWRERVPVAEPTTAHEGAFAAALGGLGLREPAVSGPVVFRYLLNLGEAQPREEQIATTWDELEETLAVFCRQEGIAVNIPFSSIAHALEHYVRQTPAEKKHTWPERETYGPLELHKIKRGGMRLLVRESAEGLWLHLLQRKDWFLGER